MNYRSALLLVLLLAGVAPREVDAQSSGSILQAAAPRLICNLTVSDDRLVYANNDYMPNTILVTITVENKGNETADSVYANLAKDSIFVISDGGPPRRQLDDFTLDPGDIGTATFELSVSRAAPSNLSWYLSKITAVISSTRGPNNPNDTLDHCFAEINVQGERLPDLSCDSTSLVKLFSQISFDDNLNRYEPEIAELAARWFNKGNDTLRDATITMVVPPSLSPDNNGPFRTVGLMPSMVNGEQVFGFRPVNRLTDTTVMLCFTIEGRGGYRDYQTGLIPIMQWTCCTSVFIPKATQPIYDVQCEIIPDTIFFIDHDYAPKTFEVRVRARNIGTSDGIMPIATISLPPGIRIYPNATNLNKDRDLISSVSAQKKLEKTSEWSNWESWEIQPDMDKRFSSKWRTEDIVINVRDYYGYTGSTMCTVNIDSIRQAMFDVYCECPDSIGVDTIIGRYENDGVITVKFHVTNVGSDYADSVRTSITYDQSSDLDLVAGDPNYPIDIHPTHINLPGRKDTLSILNKTVFEWQLKARPRAAGGYVTLTFTVVDRFGTEQICTCTIYIPKLEPPDVRGECMVNNVGYFDSLHIDPATGGYIPSPIVYTLTVKNYGGTRAENVKVDITTTAQVLNQALTGSVPYLNPGEEHVFTFTFIPLARTQYGADTDFRVDITCDNQETIPPVVHCQVFIPRMPITVALAISRDNVTYYGAASVAVPVFIDNSDDKDLKKFDLNIRYNPAVAEFLNKAEGAPTDKGGIYPDSWSGITATTIAPGELRLQFSTLPDSASGVELSGGGKLFYLFFKPVFGAGADQLNWASTDLLWPPTAMVDSLIKINNGSIKPILTSGLLYVSGDCIRPMNATDKYIITQNRPNPFNPTTTIDYYVPEASRVRIEVMDILGRTVRVLVDEVKSEGSHSVQFNSTGLPSGMYYYKMDAPGYSKVMKMMVSK